MSKKLLLVLTSVFFAFALATPASAAPIVAGIDGRTAITPPSGATYIDNILDLCEAIDGVFNHLSGDEACIDAFSTDDTSLTFSSYISLVSGMDLRLDGLSLTYNDGPFNMFSFDGGTLVINSGFFSSNRGCIFTLRDRNDFATPFNQSTDELKIFGGTFEYTGDASGDSAASPICVMTGYKSKQLALDYAKMYLPENYVFVNADTGEEITVADLELGLVSINKDSPTSVYYLNARRITIAYREPEPDDPTPDDPTPDDQTPDDEKPDDPTPPDDKTPDDPTPEEQTSPKADDTPKTPDTSNGSPEPSAEPATEKSLSTTALFLLVGICLTTYTLLIVIFTTLVKIHQGLES